jgi:hypothetical protein
MLGMGLNKHTEVEFENREIVVSGCCQGYHLELACWEIDSVMSLVYDPEYWVCCAKIGAVEEGKLASLYVNTDGLNASVPG